MLTTLAETVVVTSGGGPVSGEGLISMLVWLICVGLVFYLLWWLLGYVALPAPFDKVARVILALVAVIILINVIMSFAGHPLVRW